MSILSELSSRIPYTIHFSLTPILDVSDWQTNVPGQIDTGVLEAFTSQRRKAEYVTSRIQLRKLAAEINLDPAQFVIEKDRNGRPYGTCGTDHYFISIAHTTDKVFCGLSAERAFGIDLEPKKRKVPKGLKKRISHPQESPAINKMDLLRLWTIKEAYLKMQGQGLRMNMNEVCVMRRDDYFEVEQSIEEKAQIISTEDLTHWLAVAY